jgi:hypothetical protein
LTLFPAQIRFSEKIMSGLSVNKIESGADTFDLKTF